MRTPKEIINKINDLVHDDILGTIRGDLIEYLPYSHAHQFLTDESRTSYESNKSWKVREQNIDAIKLRMLDILQAFYSLGPKNTHKGIGKFTNMICPISQKSDDVPEMED